MDKRLLKLSIWFIVGAILIGVALFAASQMRASNCALGGSYGGTRPWCENGWLDLLLFGLPLGVFILIVDLIGIFAFIFYKKKNKNV